MFQWWFHRWIGGESIVICFLLWCCTWFHRQVVGSYSKFVVIWNYQNYMITSKCNGSRPAGQQKESLTTCRTQVLEVLPLNLACKRHQEACEQCFKAMNTINKQNAWSSKSHDETPYHSYQWPYDVWPSGTPAVLSTILSSSKSRALMAMGTVPYYSGHVAVLYGYGVQP